MATTARITLDGKEYTLRAFNIGELEEVADLVQSEKPHKLPFAILRVAMRRAEPRVEDVNALEITAAELNKAIETIQGLAGLTVPGGN